MYMLNIIQLLNNASHVVIKYNSLYQYVSKALIKL